jgi:hypothetical protein
MTGHGNVLHMTTTKKLASLFAAAVLATSMAACNKGSDSDNVATAECDAGDQREFDTDCGYNDANGNWVWYSWVVQGQTRTGPAPYAEPDGEEGGHSNNKPKKSKAPKSKSKAPAPKAVAPKVNAPKAPVVKAPAPKTPVVARKK